MKNDKEAQEKLPKVMRDALKNKASNSAPKGSRSYSTTTTPISGQQLDMGLVDFNPSKTAPEIPGAKFPLPVLPLPREDRLKERYEPLVDQVTNLLMRHGRKSVAQRVCAATGLIAHALFRAQHG